MTMAEQAGGVEGGGVSAVAPKGKRIAAAVIDIIVPNGVKEQ